MIGFISASACSIADSILVIFSSGLFPWMLPSSKIFWLIALIASSSFPAAVARSMIGCNFSMAVFGRPLSRACRTASHWSLGVKVSSWVIAVVARKVKEKSRNDPASPHRDTDTRRGFEEDEFTWLILGRVVKKKRGAARG